MNRKILRKLSNVRVKELTKLLIYSVLIVGVVIYVCGTYFIKTDEIQTQSHNQENHEDTITSDDEHVVNDTPSQTLPNEHEDVVLVEKLGGLIFGDGEQLYASMRGNQLVISKVSTFAHKRLEYDADVPFTLTHENDHEDDVLTFETSGAPFVLQIKVIDDATGESRVKKVEVNFGEKEH